jgi:hypothetical protein
MLVDLFAHVYELCFGGDGLEVLMFKVNIIRFLLYDQRMEFKLNGPLPPDMGCGPSHKMKRGYALTRIKIK